MSDKATLNLRLRTLERGSAWLGISWHPTAACVCVSSEPPPRGAAAEGYSLAQTASAALSGSVLLGVDLPVEWERVVRLWFGKRPGDPPTHHVYAEIMARYSNIIVTAAPDDTILACGLQEWRDVVVGAAALAVTAPARKGSGGAEAAGAHAGSAGSLGDGLLRGFRATSPTLVYDLCCMAGVVAERAVADVSPEEWDRLWTAWNAWLGAAVRRSFSPCSDEATTRFSMLGTLPKPHPSPMQLLDAVFGSLQAGGQHAALHQRLTTAVAGALRKARGRVAAFKAQLVGAADAEAVQRTGDLLTANLYRIAPGDASVEVKDWATGQTVTIQLDTTKTPAQVAAGLYQRARKLRRAVDAVEPLLAAALQEAQYLEEVEESLAQLKAFNGPEDSTALREVQDELVGGKYIKPPPDAALAAKAAAKAQRASKRVGRKTQGGTAAGATAGGFRRFTSPGGYQVLVGRNNKQNDELTVQVAKPDDLWLHLRGRPGSHTVIRVPGGAKQGPELGDPDVQFAADLAAYFSKARSDLKCDVMVARASAVKKPKGSKPGQVIVTKELGNVVARPADSMAAKEGGQGEG